VVTMAFVRGTEPPACGRRPAIPAPVPGTPGGPQAGQPTTGTAPSSAEPPALPREALSLSRPAAARWPSDTQGP
jgi:hypothetical protein